MGGKTAPRRLLSRRVSVADMVEFGLWLGIPYVIVGLVFAFFSIEQVRHIESLVSPVLPAGGEMAGSLGLLCIGVGVEDAATAKFLVANGCQTMQGFYFSKPLEARAVTELFGSQRMWTL